MHGVTLVNQEKFYVPKLGNATNSKYKMDKNQKVLPSLTSCVIRSLNYRIKEPTCQAWNEVNTDIYINPYKWPQVQSP